MASTSSLRSYTLEADSELVYRTFVPVIDKADPSSMFSGYQFLAVASSIRCLPLASKCLPRIEVPVRYFVSWTGM